MPSIASAMELALLRCPGFFCQNITEEGDNVFEQKCNICDTVFCAMCFDGRPHFPFLCYEKDSWALRHLEMDPDSRARIETCTHKLSEIDQEIETVCGLKTAFENSPPKLRNNISK